MTSSSPSTTCSLPTYPAAVRGAVRSGRRAARPRVIGSPFGRLMAGGSGSGGALLCIEGDQGVRTLLAVERLGGSAKATVNSGCASGRRPNKGAANRVMGASTETTPRPLNWGRRNLEDLRGPIRVDIQDHLALSLGPTPRPSVTEVFGVHPKPLQPHPIDAISRLYVLVPCAGIRCGRLIWEGCRPAPGGSSGVADQQCRDVGRPR